MKQLCRTCGLIKGTEFFYQDKSYPTGFKSSCKSCICLLAKKRRVSLGGRSKSRPSPQMAKTMEFLIDLYESYDGTNMVEIPVRKLNHIITMKRICAIRHWKGQDLITIAGQNLLDLPFGTVGPEDLIELLHQRGWTVALPL